MVGKGGFLFIWILSLAGLPVAAARSPFVPSETDTLKVRKDTLSSAVVVGSAKIRPLKVSPISTRTIDVGAMAGAGYSDITTVLRSQAPGLNIQKAVFGNDISLQGLDARHVVFLLDGEMVTGDMAGNPDYERFNIHSIDRIDIIRGGTATLFGSRASGAVINMITKKPRQALTVDAGVRYGQMNERNYPHRSKKDFLYMYEKNSDQPNVSTWLSAGVRKGRLSSQTDAQYAQSDAFYLYQKGGDRKVYKASANDFLSEDVHIQSTFPRPPMGVEGGRHISLSEKVFCELPQGLSLKVYGTGFWSSRFDMVQDLMFNQAKDYTTGAKLSWDFENYFTASASFHADFYDMYKRHELRDERLKVYDSRILQPRFTLTSDYFPSHHLILGVEYFSDELTSDRFSGSGSGKMLTRDLKETEFYAQDEWTVGRWMLTGGVRTNYSKPFGLMWMPTVAAKYSPSKAWSLRATLSKGYRSPSIKELFFNWDHLGMFMIKGNEHIRPEKNYYVSFGAEYAHGPVYLSGNAYLNVFRDKIEGLWKVYDMQYNFEYANLRRQNLAGVEALLRWDITDFLDFDLTYSYASISKSKGLRVSTTSPHAATAGLQYAYQSKNYSLSARVDASLMGSRKYDVQDRLVIEGVSHEAYFRCDLPAYTLCNVRVTQTFAQTLKLTLGVENFLNYKPHTLGSGLTAFNVPATAGARFFVQMEVKFGVSSWKE